MAGNNRRSTASGRRPSGRSYTSRSTGRSGNARTSSTRSTTNGPKRSNGRTSGANIAGAISVVLVIIIVLGVIGTVLVWTNVKYLYDNTTIVPGVEVEGVDIGGMTRDEAYFALNQKLNEKINQLSITLKHGEQYWTYDANSLNAQGDISGIIDQAMQYGHRDGMKLMDRINEAKYVLDNPETFTISFGYDQNSVRQIVETLKTDLDVPAVEPTLEFDKDAGKLTQIDDGVSLLYNPLKYDNVINVNGAPGEVYIDSNGNPAVMADIFSTTAGSAGYVVDVDSTVNAIIADLADDSIANIDIITTPVNPQYTENDLKDFTSLVYHSKSGLAYTSTFERDTNVATALEAFDGMVIMPGDVVSFNQTTGERIQSNGYMMAPGIAQDKSHELVWGGGVCQAATIIFNAAIMSGCEILDKDSHSWPLYTAADDFGEDARDAMVNWGTSDLVFKNVTEYPIYFDTYMHWRNSENATHGYCNAYTKLLPNGQSIDYEPRLMQTEEAPEPRYVALGDSEEPYDASWKWDEEKQLLVFKQIPSKPLKYYDVYQRILDAEGNVVTEQLWYKSHYDPITGKYLTKPDLEREAAEEENGVG